MKNLLLPPIFFVGFATIAYFTFDYYMNGKKRIDGTEIDWYEKWITAISFGIIGFCIGKIFAGSNDHIDGGDGDYFDCTGGAGGIM